VLAAAWAEVLGRDRVGAYDNFFDLGGDSLLLVQLHARLAELLPRELSVPDLFQFRTLAELARHLDEPEADPREGHRRADARRARAGARRGARAGAGVRTNLEEYQDEQRG
jgi:acyl carrier protein